MYNKPLIIAIVGSRSFSDYNIAKSYLDKKLKDINISKIISGGAIGADTIANAYAKERNINFQEYPADWDKYGKSAGIRRNLVMSDVCNVLIAFWDGESRGTEHMINVCSSKKHIKVIICTINKRKRRTW